MKEAQLPALYVDLHITRRKRFHTIRDAQDRTLFQTQRLTDALHWLDGEGIAEYLLVTREGCFMVKQAPTDFTREPLPWQKLPPHY